MNTTFLSADEISMFFELYVVGSQRNAGDDALAVLRLLRRARPDLNGLVVAQAWQLMQTGQLKAARRMLEEADAAEPGRPIVKAALAAVLFFANDSLWRSYTSDVRGLPLDADALAIVDSLEASADLQTDPKIARQMLNMARQVAPAQLAA